MQKTPKVNQVNEFLEIASDFENPLELIREALSNAYDADATEVEITVTSGEDSKIIIKDNGKGMDEKGLESFFDLGNSLKEGDGIGYKGHGTKIYYKSDHIKVRSAKDGVEYTAEMDKPWAKLNEKKMPNYSIEKVETEKDSYTRIEITNFKAGRGLDPGSLTYSKLEHYINWKTIGGSTEHYFSDNPHEMDIEIVLDQEIDSSRESLEMTNKFNFPEENLYPEDKEYPSRQMCRVYPAEELEIELESGTITLQIVGIVGGKEKRNELPTYGSHKSQFGVWLAKDHIQVERVNDAIGHDEQYIHFMFVANCQDIELSANREKVRNKSGEVFQAVKEEVSDFMTKVTQDSWFRDYMEQRKSDTKKIRNQTQSESIQSRVDRVKSSEDFVPKNTVETAAMVERMNARGDLPQELQVADFSPDEDVNTILQNGQKTYSTVLCPKMSDFFEEEKTLKHVERFVCWQKGDLDELREIERNNYLGDEIKFDFANDEISYVNGGEQEIEIIELSQHWN